MPTPSDDELAERIEDAIRVASRLGRDAFDSVEGRGLLQMRREIAASVARLRSPGDTPECQKCAEREARMFPIMGGPNIPWRILAPHETQALKNHGQTLERLAERGGLDPCEALQVIGGTPWNSIHLEPDAANRMLADLVAARAALPSDSSPETKTDG